MRSISQLLLTFLLNAGWQVALITAVAALCAWLLRAAAARYRHLLWVAALALSLGLPILTCSHLSDGDSFFRRPQIRVNPAVVGSERSSRLAPVETPTLLPTPLPETNPLILINRNLAAVLVIIYLLFLCSRSFKLYRAWRRTKAMTGSAYPIEPAAHVQAIISKCQTALGVTRVRLLGSAAVPVPITVGSLHPLVILPERLWREADLDVLTSAIGHELVHVLRRDYLLNLIYELIYLPLSFHPAAALLRRRIRETRELGCDELVTDRLLAAEVYARALVHLASSAVAVGRATTIITVGITDANILEERVMTMLRRPKINARKKNLLLVAATLCFAIPCLAATPFALRINIDSPDATQEAKQKEGRARAEFVMPTTDLEAGTLVAWLKKPGETVERGDAIAEVNTGKGSIKAEAFTSGVIERLLVRPGEKVPAGAVLAIIREQEPPASREVSPDQQAERERAERALQVARQQEAELEARRREESRVGFAVTLAQEPTPEAKEKREREERMLREAREKEERGRAITTTDGTVTLTNRQKEERARAEREAEERALTPEQREERRKAEREMKARQQSELVKEAKITMPQAIQIATNQYPGTVLESRLVRERDQACYLLAILSENGTETTTTRVLMSAIDGSVLNVMKQER